MASTTPARYWREVLYGRAAERGVMPGSGEPLLQAEEDNYNRAKLQFAQQISEGVTHEATRANRIGIYFAALGLLVYGRLDAVVDILTYKLEKAHPAHSLAHCIKDLIPIPRNLSVHRDGDEIIAWVRSHQDRLKWSEEEGRFLLSEDGG